MINRIFVALSSVRFSLHDEITLHQEMERVLSQFQIPFQREFRLSKEDKVDFLINDSIAVEVKIKGRAMSIYRQCERYCQHDRVTALILASSKPMGLPKLINGKPTYLLNLNENALL